MPSTAVSAQGTKLELGTTAASKTITAITQANPVRITATAHAFAEGTIVKIAAVAGMTQINGKVGSVKVVDANNFELPGIDSTSFTAYTSGGTATPTRVKVGNVKSYNGFDGQAAEIDVTNFDSTGKEYRTGLQDFGSVSIDFDVDDADDGQQALRGARANTGTASLFVLTLRNGKTRTFNALVRQFSETGAVDDVAKGTASIRVTGEVAYA